MSGIFDGSRELFFSNLACEFLVYPFWHWMTYAQMSPYPKGPLHEKKYNPVNPYEDKGPKSSTSRNYIDDLGMVAFSDGTMCFYVVMGEWSISLL